MDIHFVCLLKLVTDQILFLLPSPITLRFFITDIHFFPFLLQSFQGTCSSKLLRICILLFYLGLKLLINHADSFSRELAWGALDDVVMGGVSESTFQIDPNGGENGRPTGVFKGLFFSHLHEFQCQCNQCLLQTNHHQFYFRTLSIHVFSSGVVSTANNGGFTSIRTKASCTLLSLYLSLIFLCNLFLLSLHHYIVGFVHMYLIFTVN